MHTHCALLSHLPTKTSYVVRGKAPPDSLEVCMTHTHTRLKTTYVCTYITNQIYSQTTPDGHGWFVKTNWLHGQHLHTHHSNHYTLLYSQTLYIDHALFDFTLLVCAYFPSMYIRTCCTSIHLWALFSITISVTYVLWSISSIMTLFTQVNTCQSHK